MPHRWNSLMLLLMIDNPQQAETTSTAGQAQHFGAVKMIVAVLHHIRAMTAWKNTESEDTVAKIKEQIRSACLGVASAVEQLQTDAELKIKLLFIGLNYSLKKPKDSTRNEFTITKQETLG
ncbi:hypothetical protein B0H13DRAFT_1879197 [Mycena leptocephala]|nr:hypothetical protein B0H13DRAFT_1879197 [Mycena leptocephala]